MIAQFRVNWVNKACDKMKRKWIRPDLVWDPRGIGASAVDRPDLFFFFFSLVQPRFRGLLGAFHFSTFSLPLPWLRLLYPIWVPLSALSRSLRSMWPPYAMPGLSSVTGDIDFGLLHGNCTRVLHHHPVPTANSIQSSAIASETMEHRISSPSTEYYSISWSTENTLSPVLIFRIVQRAFVNATLTCTPYWIYYRESGVQCHTTIHLEIKAFDHVTDWDRSIVAWRIRKHSKTMSIWMIDWFLCIAAFSWCW